MDTAFGVHALNSELGLNGVARYDFMGRTVSLLAEFADIIILVLILAGVLYPALVFIGHKYGSGLIPASLIAPRVGAVAGSSLMLGLGLVLAGARYRVLDHLPPSSLASRGGS